MIETRRAEIVNGPSGQTICLPQEFRLEGDEVYVTRDSNTGELRLTAAPVPKSWDELFELIHSIEVPAEFMADRPMNVPADPRGVFDDVR